MIVFVLFVFFIFLNSLLFFVFVSESNQNESRRVLRRDVIQLLVHCFQYLCSVC